MQTTWHQRWRATWLWATFTAYMRLNFLICGNTVVVKIKWDNPNKCLLWHLEHSQHSEGSHHTTTVQRQTDDPVSGRAPRNSRSVNWGPNANLMLLNLLQLQDSQLAPRPVNSYIQSKQKCCLSSWHVFLVKLFWFVLPFNQCVLFWVLTCNAPVSQWEYKAGRVALVLKRLNI